MSRASPAIPDIGRVIAGLDGWLETMRQERGYGGPVAHWWQNRFRYTGPGLDWRYEGILSGYAALAQSTGDQRWRDRLATAALHLRKGQRADGSYRASRFEINPGALGTPHEAAATLGLLDALPHLADREAATDVARRNIDNLVARLWDGYSFSDSEGTTDRVPNKLATIAQACMRLAQRSGDDRYLAYARGALDTVVRYQVRDGRCMGAIHQYAPSDLLGDGRFFPYYIARCVPALAEAGSVLSDARYLEAAEAALQFVTVTMHDDGSWPHVVYQRGQRAEWPRWIAATADVLLAYRALAAPLPAAALERLLAGRMANGAFRTAHGFASRINQRRPHAIPDFRDITAVTGWNDKVFRLVCALAPQGITIPTDVQSHVALDVHVAGRRARYVETADAVTIEDSTRVHYDWRKSQPWARTASRAIEVR